MRTEEILHTDGESVTGSGQRETVTALGCVNRQLLQTLTLPAKYQQSKGKGSQPPLKAPATSLSLAESPPPLLDEDSLLPVCICRAMRMCAPHLSQQVRGHVYAADKGLGLGCINTLCLGTGNLSGAQILTFIDGLQVVKP